MENRIENIKSIDYGYGQLEDKLISFFTSDDLDFETAALLIAPKYKSALFGKAGGR